MKNFFDDTLSMIAIKGKLDLLDEMLKPNLPGVISEELMLRSTTKR